MKREILFGMLWGITLALLLMATFYAISGAAQIDEPGNDMEISVSSDSIQVRIDQQGLVATVTVNSDSLLRTPDGIMVQNELFIENGKIIIDGIELNEDDIKSLRVNQVQRISPEWNEEERVQSRLRRKRLATAYRDRDVISFGDIIVAGDSNVLGDIVSVAGDITIMGAVSGDVVSVFGDIYLNNGAQVRGDVTAPFGDIHRESDGIRIRGKIRDRADIERKRQDSEFGLLFHFNRVEGLALGNRLSYDDSKDRYPSLNIGGSYAFSLKRWQYRFSLSHRLGKRIGPYFKLAMLQKAETSDRWILTETANTIKSLLFTEDAYDYYWSRGFEGEAGLHYGRRFESGLLFNAVRVSNLRRTTDNGIFGGKRNFRQNWSTILPDSSDFLAMEGDLKEYGFKIDYDSRDSEKSPSSGLLVSLRWLGTGDSDSADFDYSLSHYEIKGYLSAGRNQTIMLRLRGGQSEDYLPLFRRFFLGGIGTLRGYDYKEFEGNRYVLFNSDYIWQFHRNLFGAGVFFDAGKAAFGESAFESSDIKSDLGICFLCGDFLRIDLAQRLDDLGRAPVASFRMDLLF